MQDTERNGGAEQPEPYEPMNLEQAWNALETEVDPIVLWQAIQSTHVAIRTESIHVDRALATKHYQHLLGLGFRVRVCD